MDDLVRQMLLDYERLVPEDSTKKLSRDYFSFTDEINEKMAIECFKYAFEKILHWGPRDIINGMTPQVLRRLHLLLPNTKLRYPKGLNPKTDLFYIAKICYPNQVRGFNKRDIILHTYRNILDRKDGKFGKNYFLNNEGNLRARICMQYLLQTDTSWESKKALYEFFANEKEATKYIKSKGLTQALNICFDSPLEYMHESLPSEQKDNLYFSYYSFNRYIEKNNLKSDIKCIKKNMSQDDFLDVMAIMEEYPDITNGYYPTEKDIKEMEQNPEKYLALVLYLLSTDRPKLNEDDEKSEKLMNQFIKENINLS